MSWLIVYSAYLLPALLLFVWLIVVRAYQLGWFDRLGRIPTAQAHRRDKAA